MSQVLFSDLTYIKIGTKYGYVCFITNLYIKEIVVFSIGKKPELVIEVFNTIKFSFKNTSIFNIDRSLEFKNSKINNLLETNNIDRSISRLGNPNGNAIAEAMFKTFKTTWVQGKKYDNFIELRRMLVNIRNGIIIYDVIQH